MRKTVSLILLFVFVMLAAAGCQQPAKRTSGSPLLKNEPLVDVYYFAGKLGMSITSATDNKISFNDTVNTVTILPKQNQIYVNDSYLGPLGKTKKVDGLLNIRASAGDEIQSKLAKPVMEAPAEIAPSIPQQQPKKAWQLTGRTIIIDAGHGGKDPGATSYYGYEEKTVNFDVALQISQILRDKGHRVIMTRDSDEFIELEERAAIANRNRADVFISIHSDSSATRSKNGFTLYVARSGSSASTNLADAIDSRMARTNISSNGVRKADYRVLTHTNCPAVLVELGYLSNYWEAKQLKNTDMQGRLANAIANGITDYINRR